MNINDESSFTQIEQHTISDFISFVRKMPRETIGSFPEDFAPYIIRLVGQKTLNNSFSKIVFIENIIENNEKGAICLFLPNDSEIAKMSMNFLTKLPNFQINILVVPRIGPLLEKVFESFNFGDRLTLNEFHFDLLQLEPYLFLVPAPRCFHRLYVEGDIDDLTSISRSLIKIEILNGKFPRIVTFGEHSSKITHILEEMKAQIGPSAFVAQPEFDSLIVLDRNVDLVTPLLTQFIYSGIIDEALNSKCGLIELPEEVPNENRNIILNDQDEVYKEIRGKSLKESVDIVRTGIKEIGDVKKWLVAGVDMKHFKIQAMKADNLAKKKPLYSLHLSLMSYLSTSKFESDFFQEVIKFELDSLLGLNPPPLISERLMLRDENWTEIIRIFCLASVIKHGLPSSPLHSFWLRLVERFGIEFLNDIENLSRVGLLCSQGSVVNQIASVAKTITNVAKKFATLQIMLDSFNDKFQLINKERNNELIVKQFNYDDLGSFYDGYVPLSTRLIQLALSNDPEYINTRLKLLQEIGVPFKMPPLNIYDTNPENNNTIKKVLIFVIGGITNSEISLIREMGKRIFQGTIEFYIGSTSIITSRSLIQEVIPKLKKIDGF